MKKFSPLAFLAFFILYGFGVQAQWQLNGNADATGSSLLGTTNATPLRIGTGNLERIRVATNGNIGIANSNPAARLTVQGSGGVPIASWVSAGTPLFSGFGENTVGNADFLISMASNTPLARGVFFGRRARGTLNAPLPVQANDYLTSILASGYDGTNFLSPAAVDFFVDGPVAAGSVPARIAFSTGSSGGTRTERLRVLSNGNIDMNNGLLFVNNSSASVGIGTLTPSARLQVTTPSNTTNAIDARNTFTGTVDRTAVVATSINADGYGIGIQSNGGYIGTLASGLGGAYAGTVNGVIGQAIGTGGSRIGVNGQAYNSANNNTGLMYGVFATANGGSFNAAGYFDGDVYAGAYLSTSDRKFKKDIQPLQDALDKIMQLKPARYEFDQAKFKGMHLPKGRQLGFVADEMKAVFPELVSAAVSPARIDPLSRKKTADAIDYEAVNYQGLIPVLVAALQEQQNTITELKERLSALEKDRAAVNTSKGLLGLVTPNPVRGSARIQYEVPENAANARMLITDALGRSIRVVQLARGGTIDVDASALAAGVYHCSLVVDGKTVATKKMTVVR